MDKLARIGALALLFAVTLCFQALATELERRHEPLSPIIAQAGLDPEKVALGRQLFLDPILSHDGTVRCASCHDLQGGGVDGLAHSRGIGGAEGTVNAPTIYNSGLNLAQFWDGRADSLEDQIDGPVTNPIEMGSTWAEVIGRLKDSPYKERFQKLYGQEPSPDSVRDAIASFERSLNTVKSRFDRWLQGDDGALSPEERKGYELFKSYGCTACHQGANVGGNMFQRFGLFGDPFGENPKPADNGRFNVTGNEDDRGVFKVPSLRLVVLTAPYFHDGSVTDLRQAIGMMGKYQLGREIPVEHITLIIEFLKTLPGDMEPAAPAQATP